MQKRSVTVLRIRPHVCRFSTTTALPLPRGSVLLLQEMLERDRQLK
jgi:hypothetical protein